MKPCSKYSGMREQLLTDWSSIDSKVEDLKFKIDWSPFINVKSEIEEVTELVESNDKKKEKENQ